MYTLKLKNALSYFGDIKADAKNPIVKNVQDDIAIAAVASGYFEIVSQQKGKGKANGTDNSGTGGAENPDDQDDKTKTDA